MSRSRPTPRLVRLAALGAAASLVSACGASSEVRQSVAEQRAAETSALLAGPAAASQTGPAGPAAGVATDATDATAPGGPAGTTPGTAPGTGPGRTPEAAAGAGPDAATPAGGGPAGSGKPKGERAATASGNRTAAAGAACAAAAPAGGNGGATDTGVTATSIKVGGTFFNGGFLDKYGQVSENAPRAYFNFINDSGGICGRKIEYVTCDTAGTADGTSGCLSKLSDQDKVFIMGPSLDFNLDIVPPVLAKKKLPWVGSSGLYGEEFTSPWMFPSQPAGTAVGTLITQFSAQKLGLKKMGVSFLNDVAGPACTEEAKKAASANGAQIVETASNTTIETSLDNQVSKLRNAGVEAVLFCNDPVNTVKFIQAAQRVGWKPTFVGGFVVADDVPQAAGTNGKGMYGFSFWDFYKADTPGVKRYKQITEFYFPQTFHHFYEQAAYVGAAAIVEALRATGPDLTREAFLASVKNMRAFDTGLGLTLDFANLGKGKPTGIMLQADDNLSWEQASPRFAIKPGGAAADGAAAQDVLPLVAARAAGAERTRRTRARRNS